MIRVSSEVLDGSNEKGKQMNFTDITSEQAIAILSHFRAIALLDGNKTVQAYIQGECRDEKGEYIFFHSPKLVYNIPVRKYFIINVDGNPTKVSFPNNIDLTITLE